MGSKAANSPADGSSEAVDARLTIARFNPRGVPHEAWVVIGPLARDAVAKVQPPTPRDATELLSRTASLLWWCHGQGIELKPEIVFAPDTLDRFVADGCAHLATGTGMNYRRILRRVGTAVLGPPVYPPRPLPLGKSGPVDPYSPADERALVAWSRGLPTDRMRDGAVALLGLGLGAGLSSTEIDRARASWVEDGPGGLVIVVPDARRRRVPVGGRWEWAVREALALSGGGLLFKPGRAQRKRVSVFTENLPRHDAPKLSAQRLRATWLVRHLDARVPLNVLAAAAGVSTEQLCLYAASMAEVPADEADRLLRGDRT